MIDKRAQLLRLRRYLLSLPVLIAAVALAFYALAGFFLAPYLLSREIPRFASERLKAKAAIAEVRINPFLLTAELRGFQLHEQDGRPVFAFDRLFVDFETGSVFRWAWTFAEVSLDGARLDLDIDPAGELNLMRLAHRLTPPDRKAAPRAARPPRLLLHHLAIARGRITVTDRSGPTPAQAQIDPVTFELKDLSTLRGHRGDHTVSARLPAGGTLAWRGSLALQPIAAEGEIKLKDLKVATVWRFLQDELRVEEPAGSVDLEFRYSARPERGAFQVTAADIGARAAGLNVKLRGENAPLLTLAEAAFSGGTFDLAQRRLAFARLALRRGEVSAARDATGGFDWQRLVVLESPETAAAAPMAEAGPDTGSWHVALDAVRLEEIALRASDATRTRPLALEVGRIDAEFGLSLERGANLTTTISNLQVQLAKVNLAQPGGGAPLIAFDEVALGGARLTAAHAQWRFRPSGCAAGRPLPCSRPMANSIWRRRLRQNARNRHRKRRSR